MAVAEEDFYPEAKRQVKSKVNFKFNRLSVLMFKIEDEDLGVARKIALFALDGVSIRANIMPEIDFLEVISKLDDLNISDLSQAQKEENNFIFGIRLDQQQQQRNSKSNAFELNYKRLTAASAAADYENDNVSNRQEINELNVKIASLFYVHAPKLVHDVECCLKDLKRFHARLMQDVAEKAANLALDMIKKGQTYLKNTLAELYQNETGEEEEEAEEVAVKEKISKVSLFKVKLLLETPVIAVKMFLSLNSLLFKSKIAKFIIVASTSIM